MSAPKPRAQPGASRRSGDLGTVAIVGAGKVGRALARGLETARVHVRLMPARRRTFEGARGASLVVIAVRDPEVADVAKRLRPLLVSGMVVLHVAGALGTDVLESARAPGVSVGSAHPLLAFADLRRPPPLAGGALVLDGDARAVRTGRVLARALGMTAVHLPGIDRTTYHAAAALLANGAIGLAAAAQRLLALAGVPPSRTRQLLGPLLGSTAYNLEHLGVMRALTGPVRRGDAAALRGHATALRARAPELLGLYRALVAAQLPLARELGDADLVAVERVLDHL